MPHHSGGGGLRMQKKINHGHFRGAGAREFRDWVGGGRNCGQFLRKAHASVA